jgi:hypothetical protein
MFGENCRQSEEHLGGMITLVASIQRSGNMAGRNKTAFVQRSTPVICDARWDINTSLG